MKKIENIQKRALCYAFKDYYSSYRELRQQAKKPLLHMQLLRQILIEMYKIVNKMGPTYLYEMFNFREMSYDLKNSHTIKLFNYNTTHHRNKSIRFVGAKLSKMLRNELRETVDFKASKRFVMVWLGPNSTCFNCEVCSLKQM